MLRLPMRDTRILPRPSTGVIPSVLLWGATEEKQRPAARRAGAGGDGRGQPLISGLPNQGGDDQAETGVSPPGVVSGGCPNGEEIRGSEVPDGLGGESCLV